MRDQLVRLVLQVRLQLWPVRLARQVRLGVLDQRDHKVIKVLA